MLGNVAVNPPDPIIYLISRRAGLSASAELLAVYISVHRLYPGGLHLGALVVTHAMLRRLTSWRCIIIIIIYRWYSFTDQRGMEG